jgi:nitric oxide reductase NorE protein
LPPSFVSIDESCDEAGILGNLMNTKTILVNETEDLPGDFAIWIFILAEMLVFGVMFIVYAFARSNQIEVFNESQLTLSRAMGTLNTIILITSSYFVVRAVSAIKSGNSRQSVLGYSVRFF